MSVHLKECRALRLISSVNFNKLYSFFTLNVSFYAVRLLCFLVEVSLPHLSLLLMEWADDTIIALKPICNVLQYLLRCHLKLN